MKINKLEFKAVIPTRQYENIQPNIEFGEVDDLKVGLDEGMKYIGSLIEQYSEHGSLKPTVEVGASKESFNESLEVNFEPISHVYTHDGKKLTSATTYIQKYFKKFDRDAVARPTAKAWGVNEQELKDMWESSGKASGALGTLVHEALEHYDNFSKIGATISKKKEEEVNYALPKHPVLKNIIEGFIEVNKTEGKVVAEALITDIKSGLCGHADRILVLDEAKKICRVQDYKVNVNSEEESRNNKVLAPFDKLPSNKLSKYQLQMSLYANMLQMSGWTVEGLDAFVYEDEWKHYELEVLDVINN